MKTEQRKAYYGSILLVCEIRDRINALAEVEKAESPDNKESLQWLRHASDTVNDLLYQLENAEQDAHKR